MTTVARIGPAEMTGLGGNLSSVYPTTAGRIHILMYYPALYLTSPLRAAGYTRPLRTWGRARASPIFGGLAASTQCKAGDLLPPFGAVRRYL